MVDPSRRRPCVARCIAAAVLSLTPAALANGRFPNAQVLREPSPGVLVLAGTYGLLLSANAGADFQFVCESELFSRAAMGDWIDPLLEALPDGTLFTGSRHAVRITRDRGCSFTTDWSLPVDPVFSRPPAGTSFVAGAIIDLCRATDGSSAVVALAALSGPSGGILQHQLYRALPGEAFRAFGKPIPFDAAPVTLTVDAAPGRPGRFYVSASKMGQSLLLVTDDAAETWTSKSIPAEGSEAYIGAVSPTDPDRLYVRARRQAETDEGSTTWEDTLLVSDDAGSSFREVLRRQAALLGFALSPDGKTVLAGYGDPREAPIVTLDTALGLYSADSQSLTFEHRVSDLSITCLYWTSQGLYACAHEVDPLGLDANAPSDFHLGVFRGSGVPSARGDFSRLLKLKDVRGPLPRTDGKASACETEWSVGDPLDPAAPAACKMLNACGATGQLANDALRCPMAATGGAPAGSAGQPTMGGTSSPGGSSGSGGAAAQAGAPSSRAGNASRGGGGAGSNGGGANTNEGSGCNCDFSTVGSRWSPGWLLLFVVAMRRRRALSGLEGRDQRNSPSC